MDEPQPGHPPPSTLDELAEALRARRAAAGAPSFTTITQRVARQRTARGVHTSEASPGRVTVYDCFRSGRRRVDVDLVVDIVGALGADAAEQADWRGWCHDLLQTEHSASIVESGPLSHLADVAFVGRERALSRMSASHGIIVVTGMAGTGKSTLARRWLAGLVRSGRIARAVEVRVRGAESRGAGVGADEVVGALARAIGHAAVADPALASEQLADAFAHERIGVLVDDIASLAQIEPLRAISAVAPFVVTSRRRLSAPGATIVEPGSWTPGEAERFLRSTLGDERIDEEPDAADAIAELSGRHPLALALWAARIADRGSWNLADHLAALRLRSDQNRLDPPVSDAIALSHDALGAEEGRALRLLAVQPSDLLAERELAHLIDRPRGAARAIVGRLAEVHLVQTLTDGHVGMHALIRAFATARSWEVDAPSQRERALDRLFDNMIERAHAAVEAVYPGHLAQLDLDPDHYRQMDRDEADAWLVDEVQPLIEVAEAIVDRRPQALVEVSDTVGRHLDRRGHLDLMHALHERAHALSQRGDDPFARARSTLYLGQARLRLGMEHRRLLREARDEAVELGYGRVELSAANALAISYAQAGDLPSSLAALRDAMRAVDEHGFADLRQPLIDNIGVVLTRMGDLDGAAVQHRESYAVARERGDDTRASTAMSNLSEVLLRQGDAAGAAGAARTALSLLPPRTSDPLAYAHTNLGLALNVLGDKAAARDAHEHALALSIEMGDVVLESGVHSNLAIALLPDDVPAAREHLERGLAVADAHDVAFEGARALIELAALDIDADDAALAVRRLDRALDLLPDPGSPERSRALALRNSL